MSASSARAAVPRRKPVMLRCPLPLPFDATLRVAGLQRSPLRAAPSVYGAAPALRRFPVAAAPTTRDDDRSLPPNLRHAALRLLPPAPRVLRARDPEPLRLPLRRLPQG